MFRKNKIEFLIADKEVKEVCDPPVKASKALPEWIKVLENENKGILTAKRCLPLIEASSEGYVWRTHTDIEFVVEEEEKGILKLFMIFPNHINQFPVIDEISIISPHDDSQAYLKDQNRSEIQKLHGNISFKQIYKFNNLYLIKTPKGYSCRFKSLSNNFNLPFQFFEGVVETDHHYDIINFPFRYTGPLKPHKYFLKKGTPLLQIIPFKREKWTSSVGIIDNVRFRKQHFKLKTHIKNAYRNQVKENNGGT